MLFSSKRIAVVSTVKLTFRCGVSVVGLLFVGVAQTSRPASGCARFTARVRESAGEKTDCCADEICRFPFKPSAFGGRRPTRGYVGASPRIFAEAEETSW